MKFAGISVVFVLKDSYAFVFNKKAVEISY